ncbi:MAG: tyrosine-protein kinase domain-containing protein [Candidatus Dormibacteraceae bacterium]
MELIRYVRVLRRRLWMIVICPIVAAVAAGVVSFGLPSIYEAQVVVLVRPAQPLASTDPTVAALSADQISSTYASLMTERPLLESVIADLGLKTRWDALAPSITVTPEPNTTILDVRVQNSNPTLARDVANRLVADFIAEVKQIQQQETQLPNARSGDNLVVVSPAVVPDRPVSPNRARNVATAFGAGLLLALAIAYLLEFLDQSIKSDEELTERLGLISVGHIPFAPAGKGRLAELVVLDTHSPASEAYRALRTSLMFSTIDQELKTIVVTSSAPSEGKSRTAANLAIVLAEAGHKTLLIDADFRRPSLHKIFGRIRNIGLSNLILQDVAENEAITAVEKAPNLWLVTSGPLPPNPSELLGSGRVRELMARLRNSFTYVILDTPPVNAVTDAAILAAAANGTILVVEQGRTTFPALGHAKQLLDRVGAHTIGVVMNKVRASAGSYSYEYGNYGTPPDQHAERESREPYESEPRITVRD